MKPSDLIQRTQAAVWHPCTQMKQQIATPPLAITRGHGVWLHDADGRAYIDAISSWWVNLFGHANPRINAAICDQLNQIEHVMLAGCTHAPVVALSERLGQLTGLGHAFYGSDGASATEIALKMSFHYWRNRGQAGKTEFISLQNSYHGETLGALSVTDVAIFKDTYAPLLRHSTQVMSPDWRLAEAGESAEQYAERAAQDLASHLAQHHQQVAALIVEPLVQGAAGMAMYHAVYLTRVRQLCDQYNVHLIADEIAVGFGRTGTMFACEQAAIKPDLMCLSKGITGGYLPLSAVLATDEIYSAFYDDATARGFLHSHSYTGNPLACRAALATLDIFAQDQVLANNRSKGDYLDKVAVPLREHARVTNFRRTGMIWAFDVAGADASFAREFYLAALDQGLLLRPIGNTVYFMPPYVISEAEIDQLVRGSLAALVQVTGVS
ncbi:adenosylmethionine--8-amino-7-oxononanoate transaminase [Sulfuriferula thiophila]|uniref:adenosylmethionine--8-amino-7-oxononanoate transaminase n=1 Tax=Sulfuriferula thiophila TaxID=1781211 RepID=UPI000F608CEF|nr:adenosylmethionine--8-amino-7-oxononanoate transaminase [Sulfuriferula thiophila]